MIAEFGQDEALEAKHRRKMAAGGRAGKRFVTRPYRDMGLAVSAPAAFVTDSLTGSGTRLVPPRRTRPAGLWGAGNGMSPERVEALTAMACKNL